MFCSSPHLLPTAGDEGSGVADSHEDEGQGQRVNVDEVSIGVMYKIVGRTGHEEGPNANLVKLDPTTKECRSLPNEMAGVEELQKKEENKITSPSTWSWISWVLLQQLLVSSSSCLLISR